MSPAGDSPVFARFYAWLSEGVLEREIAGLREELVGGISGKALEVGAGNGMNFGHYGAAAEVLAVEPDSYLRERASLAARKGAASVVVVEGDAEALDLPDESFGDAVACLVLCTVPDPARALREIRRVLEPGGRLHFFEHVRSRRPRQRSMQRWLDRTGIWPRLGGGCHCHRDTAAAIAAAGFEIERIRPETVGPAAGHTSPHVIGTAIKPG